MILQLIILCAYLGITVFTSFRISKSITPSSSQKAINIVINCLAPVLWYNLISPIIFPKGKTITKDEREKMIAEENGSRMENGVGSSTHTGLPRNKKRGTSAPLLPNWFCYMTNFQILN